ncbi:MAG TPA: hypothetical protein VFB45_20525 [Pseudolabrys sp.]|nr:hypothetical protein [Pseudolabrys sp.]
MIEVVLRSGVTVLLMVVLGACASQRIQTMTPQYAQGISDFHRREVLANLSATIDDFYYVPRQTSVGAGKLTFTDTSSVNVSAISLPSPAHTGQFGATLGGLVDSYETDIASTEDRTELRRLRKLYQAAVQPHRGSRWLFWSPELVPPQAVSLGLWGSHELWSTDPQRFNELVLDTLPAAPKPAKKTPATKSSNTPAITPDGKPVLPR